LTTESVKTPEIPSSNNWNEPSVWTVESDEDSVAKMVNNEANSSFYSEALIMNKTLGPKVNSYEANLELIRAVREGRIHAIVKSLSNGADPDSTVEEDGDTFALIHLATKNHNVSAVSLLIAHGANIESATKFYWTALHLASYHGYGDIIKVLLENGAKLNVQNQFGQTPVMMAVGENHPKAAELLVKAGADLSLESKKKSTALTLCKTVEMKALLMNNGQIEQTQGPLRFELFIEVMSNQLNLLKNETARYELIETQNEKLNQDLEVTRLERESIRKTLTTICDERDDIQNELERITKELNKTSALLNTERTERIELESMLEKERTESNQAKQELSDKILEMEQQMTDLVRRSTLERQASAKQLSTLSEKFTEIMNEAKEGSVPKELQTDTEKLQEKAIVDKGVAES